jgi:hypothetical protein
VFNGAGNAATAAERAAVGTPVSGKPISAPAWVINPPTHDAKKTFCVLGVARGGTSMVAGVLAQLGVPMGDTIDKDNIEDQSFLGHGGVRSLFTDAQKQGARDEYLNKAREIIAARNRALNVWGWKDPICILYLPLIANALVNSHFIFVTRDPGAVAMREMLEERVIRKQRLFAFLGQSLGEYRSCVDLLVGLKRPTLLVSYERALRFPEVLAEVVHAFVHPAERSIPDDKLAKIVSYIVPDRRTGDINAEIGGDSSSRGAAHTAASFLSAPLFGDFDRYLSRMDEWASRRTEHDADLKPDKPQAAMNEAEFHAWLIRLYIPAAAASNRGSHEVSVTLSCRLLRELLPRAPIIGLGPVAVARATEVDCQSIAAVPDLLVGTYNILGMAALLTGDPRTACDYFDAGYSLARKKIELASPSSQPISINLLWWLVFHSILAAKHSGREGIVRRGVDAIRGYLNDIEAGVEDRLNAAAARDVYERAIRENLIGSQIRVQT